MQDRTDIHIAGVGGQGSLTASRLLGEAAAAASLRVLVGEIHGMAQRGGVVESTVRIGNVYGPIVPDHSAGVLLGFEPVETVRCLTKASRQTLIISNTRPIVPFSLAAAGKEYPRLDALIGAMHAASSKVLAFDATAMARDAGNAKAVGTVLLGALAGAGVLPFAPGILGKAITDGVPPRAREVNRLAFAAGIDFARRHQQELAA